MRSEQEITTEIEQLVQAHYYSEDFELLASLRAYVQPLSPGEREHVRALALRRLMRDGSIVDIMLCSVIDVPSAVPVLAGKLDREPVSNQVTRTLIQALRRYHTDEAYTAVERFVDSDQELEAIDALADIDFRRTIPMIVRVIGKEHHHGNLLHLLHRFAKERGVERLAEELTGCSATRSARFVSDLERVLRAKKEPYNPFTEDQILHILSLVG
ncbi:MAG TPA: hypothetical protein PKC67_01360 [Kiritimatiellia bacterium]|nr:hypothetical protein [Kiritimatiellia bacterium]HMP32969.1 hypothetical protein [Kiritimatiellia bacterium]